MSVDDAIAQKVGNDGKLAVAGLSRTGETSLRV